MRRPRAQGQMCSASAFALMTEPPPAFSNRMPTRFWIRGDGDVRPGTIIGDRSGRCMQIGIQERRLAGGRLVN